jgi:hypothetical protein
MSLQAIPAYSRERAAALLIVLAFVVLLTGLSVAYVSRTTGDRQVADSSFHQASVDQLTQTAMDNIIGDLRQEITDPVASSTSVVNVNGVNVTIYTPTSAAYMVPQRNVNLPGVYNLIRRSDRSDPLIAPARPSRASAVNSMTDVSANGRYVTSTRWNAHYLIPKGNVNTNDPSPTPTFDAVTPDWVFVTAGGATPSPPAAEVIGRYAYAIYDEGGLLDANLVGLPSPTPGGVTVASPSPSRTVYPSRKGTVAFADVTALRLTPLGSTPNPLTISRMVGWRNYATTLVPTNKTFPDLSPSPTEFVTYFTSNSSDFLTVSPTVNARGRTDQAFTTRSELIQLVLSLGGSPNLLQYLGTFSRELNCPTWHAASNPISQRFQLDQISLLGSSPTPSPSGGNASVIQAKFGLQWSAITRRWQYVGTQGTSLLSAISTPGPSGSPQPDFFQILNYAYPGHTIGQILSLGASIIDQYDADQVTTGIEYAPAPAVAWGAEDRNPVIAMGTPVPSPSPTATVTPALQRPFQNAGELGYAYNPVTGNTLDFRTSGSSEAALLDFFTYNITDNTAISHLPYPVRAGPVNVNTRNSAVIAALLTGALPIWPPPGPGVPSSSATPAATLIINATSTQPAGYDGGQPVGRQDLARLAAAVATTFGSTEQPQETVPRALSDTTQTRTWGLLIDVIAQTGRYTPDATSIGQGNKFVVQGEQHYWVHVAIDRFTNQVIDKQIEVVND